MGKVNYMMTAQDVADALGCSVGKVYIVIKSLNDELKEMWCESKELFISKMRKRGWKVIWKDSRKNITFENEEGKKVRDKNLSKTFNLNITKQGLLSEFERQSKIRSKISRYNILKIPYNIS